MTWILNQVRLRLRVNPIVTVILCCYNQQDYVEHAVQSVLAQTYSNWELLLIDNGSTDGSAERMRQFQSNPRVRIFEFKENESVTKRYNQALKQARGEFVSILYADDWYLPKKLEVQVAALSNLPASYGVVYCPGLRLNVLSGKQWVERSLKESGNILERMFQKYHLEGFINPISPLFRRACFEKFPYLEKTFIEGEAIHFRMATTFQYQFMEEPQVVMRDHPNNAGKAIKKTMGYEIIIIKHLLEKPEFPVGLRPAARQYLARALRNYGWQGVRVAHDPAWARQCLNESIRWDGWQRLHPRLIGAYALTLIPKEKLELLNHTLNTLRKHESLQVFKEENR